MGMLLVLIESEKKNVFVKFTCWILTAVADDTIYLKATFEGTIHIKCIDQLMICNSLVLSSEIIRARICLGNISCIQR